MCRSELPDTVGIVVVVAGVVGAGDGARAEQRAPTWLWWSRMTNHCSEL